MAYMECHFRSDRLDMNTSVHVILPDDMKEDEKFKVLYLFHGYVGDHTDWIRFTSIERYARQYRLAVVMPQVNNSYYTDMVYGMPYFSYVSEELPQWITKTFPISKKRNDNYICGLSMGGYGALKVALTYPTRYSKAASLSGVVDIDHIRSLSVDNKKNTQYEATFGLQSVKDTPNDLKYLINQIKKNQEEIPDLFIGCGTEDFLFGDNREFKSFLDKQDIKNTYVVSKGEHSWDFWDEYIQKVLKWIFEK